MLSSWKKDLSSGAWGGLNLGCELLKQKIFSGAWGGGGPDPGCRAPEKKYGLTLWGAPSKKEKDGLTLWGAPSAAPEHVRVHARAMQCNARSFTLWAWITLCSATSVLGTCLTTLL